MADLLVTLITLLLSGAGADGSTVRSMGSDHVRVERVSGAELDRLQARAASRSAAQIAAVDPTSGVLRAPVGGRSEAPAVRVSAGGAYEVLLPSGVYKLELGSGYYNHLTARVVVPGKVLFGHRPDDTRVPVSHESHSRVGRGRRP